MVATLESNEGHCLAVQSASQPCRHFGTNAAQTLYISGFRCRIGLIYMIQLTMQSWVSVSDSDDTSRSRCLYVHILLVELCIVAASGRWKSHCTVY